MNILITQSEQKKKQFDLDLQFNIILNSSIANNS